MQQMNFSEIDDKYKTELVGYYNARLDICLECDHHLNWKTYPKDNFYGIGSLNGTAMIIVECPACFEKYYHHLNPSIYDYIKWNKVKRK